MLEKDFFDAIVEKTEYPVHYVRAIDAEPPYLVVNKISDIEERHQQGGNGLREATIRTNIFASTYTTAKGIESDIKKAGLKGDIKNLYPEATQDLYDSDTKLFHIAVDFKIQYTGGQ